MRRIMQPNKQDVSSLLPGAGFVLLLVLLLAGCAGTSTLTTQPVEPEVAGAGAPGWWYARFRMVWPENTEPDWSMDTLIADRIVSPVLQRYRQRIELWRFHRRAVRDQTGHQFSFIFYASAQTAREIFQAIDRNVLLAQLKQDRKLEQMLFDSTDKITRPNREDTSDRNWPMIIQKSWPHFIQGASRMWLDMIQTLAPEAERRHPDALYAVYQDVQAGVNTLWKEEGGHVFLHHLSALYAYQPVIVIERKVMRF